MIPRLTDMVSACKGVFEYRGNLWGQLTEDDGNIPRRALGSLHAKFSAPAAPPRQERRCTNSLRGASNVLDRAVRTTLRDR